MATDSKVLVEFNVGGMSYATCSETVHSKPGSLLSRIVKSSNSKKDGEGRYFIDRDPQNFKYILDYLRNKRLCLPDDFKETEILMEDAKFYKIPTMIEDLAHAMQTKGEHTSRHEDTSRHEADRSHYNTQLCNPAPPSFGHITIGYRGSVPHRRNSRDCIPDVNFRKISRILVSGRVSLCRDVFHAALNEDRDPDRGDPNRYTSRFYLRHHYLELAFDTLSTAGFRMVASSSSGITTGHGDFSRADTNWGHYNEFVFFTGA